MANAQRIADFDTWKPGYAYAKVAVYLAGTTTLVNLFSDWALTVSVSNPVTLLAQSDGNGVGYGKFQQPIYVGVPVYLAVNSTDSTGEIHPPITSLDDQDASEATVVTTRGVATRALEDALDTLDILNFGAFSAGSGATTNTTTLNLAIGAAAAQGGGPVLLPSGTFPINPVTLSAGVHLRGQSSLATILTCQAGSAVVTIGGNDAGLEELTLSGLTSVASSVGVEAINKDRLLLRNCVVKSFATGIRMRGGNHTQFQDCDVTDCSVAAVNLRGDLNSGGGSNGAVYQNFLWLGGKVASCAAIGVVVECIDRLIQNLRFVEVIFDTNVGPAFKNVGARNVTLEGCAWTGNTAALSVVDGSDVSQVAINTVEQFYLRDGVMSAGTVTLNQTCLDVQFQGMSLQNTAIALSVPTNPILMVDCLLDANVTTSGDSTKLLRQRTGDALQQVAGVTTDANATTAWQYVLADGETIIVEAKVIGRQRNGINVGAFHVEAGISRPGAGLPYDTQTVNFTVGSIITGQTSGATARITADADSGVTGTLTIRDITGTFVIGETIHDAGSGSARMSGAITHSNAAVDDVGVTTLRAMGPTTSPYAATINVSGGTARVQVTGVVNTTVEWIVAVSIIRP